MPERSAATTLILLFAGVLLLGTLLAAAYALVAGNRDRARLLLFVAATLVFLYLGAIVTASASSNERVPALRESHENSPLQKKITFSLED